MKLYNKKYREINRKKLNGYSKRYYDEHTVYEQKRHAKYWHDHKDALKKKRQQFKEEHYDEFKARQIKYNLKHKIKRTEWKRTNKERWIVRLLGLFGELKCQICGYNKYFEVLDFHHRDPSKKDKLISSFLLQPINEERLNEVKKCSLLCSNCHREFHLKTKEG
jgi:hypothetical protein